MSTEQNKSIVRRAFDSMSEGQDQFLAEHDEIYGENLVGHFSGMPPVDRDMHRQFGLATYSSFPDLKRPVEDLVAEGDKVVARWSSVGTHSGDFMGTPPSGKTVRTTGITIFRLADGK
ncbi:MAG TPA: ester cyclase, partial [Thermoanaerobaculia bacterium]|nr:ester cyclase [Thermoanaerobaculia bacterium]